LKQLFVKRERERSATIERGQNVKAEKVFCRRNEKRTKRTKRFPLLIGQSFGCATRYRQYIFDQIYKSLDDDNIKK